MTNQFEGIPSKNLSVTRDYLREQAKLLQHEVLRVTGEKFSEQSALQFVSKFSQFDSWQQASALLETESDKSASRKNPFSPEFISISNVPPDKPLEGVPMLGELCLSLDSVQQVLLSKVQIVRPLDTTLSAGRTLADLMRRLDIVLKRSFLPVDQIPNGSLINFLWLHRKINAGLRTRYSFEDLLHLPFPLLQEVSGGYHQWKPNDSEGLYPGGYRSSQEDLNKMISRFGVIPTKGEDFTAQCSRLAFLICSSSEHYACYKTLTLASEKGHLIDFALDRTADLNSVKPSVYFEYLRALTQAFDKSKKWKLMQASAKSMPYFTNWARFDISEGLIKPFNVDFFERDGDYPPAAECIKWKRQMEEANKEICSNFIEAIEDVEQGDLHIDKLIIRVVPPASYGELQIFESNNWRPVFEHRDFQAIEESSPCYFTQFRKITPGPGGNALFLLADFLNSKNEIGFEPGTRLRIIKDATVLWQCSDALELAKRLEANPSSVW